MADDPYDFAPAPKSSSNGSSSSGSKAKKASKAPGASASQPAQAPQPLADSKVSSPVKIKASTPKKNAVTPEDDEYGDDFEDYNDDFEDAEEPVVNQAKISAPAATSPNRESKKPQAAPSSTVPAASAPAQPKASPISDPPQQKKQSGSTTSAQPNFSSSSSSTSDSSSTRKKSTLQKLNLTLSLPKNTSSASKRLQRLFAAGVMDLQLENTTCTLNIPSSSRIDLYYRQLRSAVPTIRQVGCPSDETARDIDVQTEGCVMVDQYAQFNLEDDTEFYRVLDQIKMRKGRSPNGLTGIDSMNSVATASKQSLIDASQFSSTSTRLSAFLQAAVPVMETLLSENTTYGPNSPGRGRRDSGDFKSTLSLFNHPLTNGSGWIPLGTNVSAGGNALLATRKTSQIVWSGVQRNMLACVHPRPVVGSPEEEEDLRPGKGLVSLWDALWTPHTPAYILQTSGEPTSVSFSSTQSFLVIIGCAEGSIHLFDLRENADFHRDQDSADLKIDKGIRKPCYSTPTEADGLENDFSSMQHAGPITAIHSIPDPFPQNALHAHSTMAANTQVSQWCSIDLLGTVALWITKQTQSPSSGQAPWASITLSLTKILCTDAAPSRSPSRSQTHALKSAQDAASASVRGRSAPLGPVLATIPGDSGTFLATTKRGGLQKIHRFGEVGVSYTRPIERVYVDLNESNRSAGVQGDTSFYSSASCIAVGPVIAARGVDGGQEGVHSGLNGAPSEESTQPLQLILVGRSDSTVDVYSLDIGTPLRSYYVPVLRETLERAHPQLASTLGSAGKSAVTGYGGKYSPSEIVRVGWLPGRVSAFYAVDQSGLVFVFDMLLGGLQSIDSLVEDHSGKIKLTTGSVALSLPAPPKSTSSQSRSTPVSHVAVVRRSKPTTGPSSVVIRPIWEGWNTQYVDRSPRMTLARSTVGVRAVDVTNGGASDDGENALRRYLFSGSVDGCALGQVVVEGKGVVGGRK